MYQAVRETLDSKPSLLPFQSKVNTSKDVDYYQSIFYYTDKHRQIYNSTGTLSGIKDTTTNKLYFDFDDKINLEAARQDALALCFKLHETLAVPTSNILAYFSGNKGFHVEVLLDRFVTQTQFKAAVYNLALEYKSFDSKVNDANRVIRINNTKNPQSGLYKIPLSLLELEETPINDIRELAKAPRYLPLTNKPVSLADHLFERKEKYEEEPKDKAENLLNNNLDIDFTKKVKGWSNCKWALIQGFGVSAGDRHDKLLCIIATAKALNNTEQLAYYYAKSADELGVERNGGDKHDKKKLWEMVESVYTDKWKGGTFSCRDGKSQWLTNVCSSLGIHKCKKDENTSLVEVDKVFSEFEQFAKDIDKHTIKTGIVSLDAGVRFRTGQMIGLLGAPSSGKTALALEILENISRQNLLSVFYSLDMSSSELFQKIAQRVTGLCEDDLFNILRTDKEKSEVIRQQVCSAYNNVKFCFDTGVSVEAIQNTITEFESQTNNKVVLLMLDYNELLSGVHSDQTANSGHNAGLLKKLTNHNQICTISLLQPPKVVGDASDEIVSYRNIKGSSLLEQCFSVVIGLSRPGFSPKNDSEQDKFMIMNVLKNRLGRLFHLNFYWDGLRGKIDEIRDTEGEQELKEVVEKKRQESAKSALF